MGKALIIAEKPSVAGDIAKALGGFAKDKSERLVDRRHDENVTGRIKRSDVCDATSKDNALRTETFNIHCSFNHIGYGSSTRIAQCCNFKVTLIH